MAHRMKMETHDIPEWAIYYLAYGECDGLTEDEVDMLTAFIEFNFPMGYTMEVQWDGLHDGGSVGQLQRVRHASGLRTAHKDLSGGLLYPLRQMERQVKKRPVFSIYS